MIARVKFSAAWSKGYLAQIGGPCGGRGTMTRDFSEKVSAATIRNVMAGS